MNVTRDTIGVVTFHVPEAYGVPGLAVLALGYPQANAQRWYPGDPLVYPAASFSSGWRGDAAGGKDRRVLRGHEPDRAGILSAIPYAIADTPEGQWIDYAPGSLSVRHRVLADAFVSGRIDGWRDGVEWGAHDDAYDALLDFVSEEVRTVRRSDIGLLRVVRDAAVERSILAAYTSRRVARRTRRGRSRK